MRPNSAQRLSVGTARAKPIYMKPGDLSVCSIERIGVLTNPVAASAPGAADHERQQ